MVFGLSSFYNVWFVVVLLQRLVCRHLITTFGLSSLCYDVVFFVVLLLRFIFMGAVQIGKVDSIN